MENTKRTKKKKKKNNINKFLVFIILIGLAYFGLSTYYKSSIGPMNTANPTDVDIIIPASSTTTDIGEILYSNNLIKHPLIFQYIIRTREVGNRLKAGQYNLSTDMNLDEIVDSLVKGTKNYDTAKFTIPEGYEIRQMAEKLSDEGLVDGSVFLDLTSDKSNFEDDFEFLKELNDGQSLEGFLFPSTYEIYKDANEEEIIEKMLSQFENIYKSEVEPNMDKFDLSFNEVITLASIIEREGKLDRERPIMSAVFHNRIDQGMMLQSCATVQFILGERKEVLSNADTRIESPFNTYINMGLPPSPIASPGKASLVAAVNPDDVDYLFFVKTGSDGSHTFTKTYDEHLNAKPNN